MQHNAGFATTNILPSKGAWGRLKNRTGIVAWALFLLCSLVFVPMLSRVHQLVHSSHVFVTGEIQPSAGVNPDHAHQDQPKSAWERLFSPHADGSPLCEVLDHTGSFDAAEPQLHQLIVETPDTRAVGVAGLTVVRDSLSFFHARGPPDLL